MNEINEYVTKLTSDLSISTNTTNLLVEHVKKVEQRITEAEQYNCRVINVLSFMKSCDEHLLSGALYKGGRLLLFEKNSLTFTCCQK